jgi:hypothetical protein
MDFMQKYTNDKGQIAVLYSPSYGSGWYSWNNVKELLFDPKIVELVLNREENTTEAIRTYVEETYPDEGIYCGSNVEDLEICWLEPGTRFRISEYDGAESVVKFDDDEWFTA